MKIDRSKEPVVIIYDGECPVCRNISLKRKLDAGGVTLQLVDARQLPPLQLADLRARGYDLNQGMIVKAGGALYFGHDALQVLISLSRHQSRLVTVMERCYAMLDRPRLYATLVRARLMLLKLLRRKPIHPG